ncbi:MAG: tetratricopeptide repeat protein [Deltaproteobacteria bacterium]|nr:tetratricopeptide repeat protein [Deltaproteobacteria bacterium]
MGKTVFFAPVLVLVMFGGSSALAAAADQEYLGYYEQGEFALRVQKWDRAIELFTKTIEKNPQFFVAYHNRAIAYSKKGEYDKSIADLKKAVELNPDYPDAYGLMGLVFEIKKDYASALKAYQEGLKREKRDELKKILQRWIKEIEGKMKKQK